MMPTARLGDGISHGGAIVSGSPDTLTDGIPTARIGDKAVCKDHGSVTIVTGSPRTMTNGLPTARLGDKTSCGASIISGSPKRLVG